MLCWGCGEKLVGARRFELRTSWSRTKRATRLRYAPTGELQFIARRGSASKKRNVPRESGGAGVVEVATQISQCAHHPMVGGVGLERRLNNGREIKRTLKVSQLRRGDQLFITGEYIAMVRRSKAGRFTYWLNGQLDLEQSAIHRIQNGKYEVLQRVVGQDGGLVEAPAPALAESVVAVDLDEAMDERSEMMQTWANYLDSLQSSDNVVPIKKAK